MNSFSRTLLFLTILLLSAACQIDYDLAGGEDDEAQPDILMTGVIQIQKDGKSRIILKAQRAAFFSDRGETVFDNLDFLDYGEGETLLRRGLANRAQLFDNRDARLTGGVLLESFEDDIRVEGDILNWKDDLHQLSSPPEEGVLLTLKGEKEIEGNNFMADFKLNEISFESPVKGMMVIDE